MTLRKKLASVIFTQAQPAQRRLRSLWQPFRATGTIRFKISHEKPGWVIARFSAFLLASITVLWLANMTPVAAEAANQENLWLEGASSEPALTPDISPTPTPKPETASMAMSMVEPTADTYFTAYTYRSWDIPEEISSGSDLWIEIDLTNQMLYAYHGNQLIGGFLVSTGTSQHKTVTGAYKIYAKHPSTTMAGPGYYLEGVPYSMYFYKGYAIHGTYWHDNFGTPMSHGCVNMETDHAAWLYEHAGVGANIFVHY